MDEAREMIEAAFPPEGQPTDAEIRAVAAFLVRDAGCREALRRACEKLQRGLEELERQHPELFAEEQP